MANQMRKFWVGAAAVAFSAGVMLLAAGLSVRLAMLPLCDVGKCALADVGFWKALQFLGPILLPQLVVLIGALIGIFIVTAKPQQRSRS